MSGEFDFINWLRARSPSSDSVIVPPGDDLAVLKWDASDLLLVGVDQVLDGVHFDSTVHSPRTIGRKVMNRNLSDCAAMACLPAAAVATVALPRDVGLEYIKQLYLGLRDAIDPFDCPIVGGDTASWDERLVLTVTILGRSAGIKPITRAGGRAGDRIYVTGPLGGSILGRHLCFEPRIEMARLLAQAVPISAMIDISDGLSRDLGHICSQGGVGAMIEADAVPIHDDARRLGQRDGQSALTHALNDGEDHELLFATPADPAVLAQYPGVTSIGQLTAEPGMWLLSGDGSRLPLEPRGWEHRLANP